MNVKRTLVAAAFMACTATGALAQIVVGQTAGFSGVVAAGVSR